MYLCGDLFGERENKQVCPRNDALCKTRIGFALCLAKAYSDSNQSADAKTAETLGKVSASLGSAPNDQLQVIKALINVCAFGLVTYIKSCCSSYATFYVLWVSHVVRTSAPNGFENSCSFC